LDRFDSTLPRLSTANSLTARKFKKKKKVDIKAAQIHAHKIPGISPTTKFEFERMRKHGHSGA